MSDDWYLNDGRVNGPYSSASIKDMINAGILGPTDTIASDPNGPWMESQSVFDVGSSQVQDLATGSRYSLQPGPPTTASKHWDFVGYVLLAIAVVLLIRELVPRSPPPTTWPTAFETSNARISGLRYPGMSDEVALDMSKAYGFVALQKIMVLEIWEKYPSLGGQVLAANTEFDAQFGGSVTTIDSILAIEIPNWWQQRSRIQENLRDFFILQDRDQATEFIRMLRERSNGGGIDRDVLATFLTFNPKYARRPHLEMTEGHKLEYRTDGMGKSLGLRIGVEYPASWLADDGRRPHVVQTFKSMNGHGLEMFLIQVRDTEGLLVSEDVFDFDDSLCLEALPNGKIIASGFANTAGVPTFWCEVVGRQERAGVGIELAMLNSAVIVDGRFVMFQFSVGAPIGRGDHSATLEYRRFGPLFQQMWNAIDFFDRYEQFD